MIRDADAAHALCMKRRTRRDFWDWVYILGDGLMAVLAAFFVVVALIANLGTGLWPFSSRDDSDAKRR